MWGRVPGARAGPRLSARRNLRLAEKFGVDARVLDGKVLLRRERAHELIPRIVEAQSKGALHSISFRHTGLGEVFLELTGHELEHDVAPVEAPGGARGEGAAP